MGKFKYQAKRYKVQAKRLPEDKEWTDWVDTDNYDDAVKQLDKVKELGFCGEIVDRFGIDKVAKMLDEEYRKARDLDYVKNPLAFALYAVWKKVDKEGKKCKELN